jgi:DNA polymerase III subunit delta
MNAMTSIYLICGEDILKRDAALKRLNARFEKMGDLCFNSDTLMGENTTADEIINSCNTMPFSSDLRLVVVKDAERLSKTAVEGLVTYCAKPCESTVLVLVAGKLAKNSILYKAVKKHFPKSIVDCTPKKRKELPTLVANMAQVYNVSINPAAAEMLIAYVGESTVRLDSELEKMATSLGKQKTIDEELVARMVTRSAEAKPWELTDAFSTRDPRRCEQVLMRLDGQSPFGLLALSLTRIRELIATKALEQRGSAQALATTLGRPDWQVRNYRSWAARFTSEELRSALERAADVERAMKSGANQDSIFEHWVLSLCRREV